MDVPETIEKGDIEVIHWTARYLSHGNLEFRYTEAFRDLVKYNLEAN
jgi:hypothetical protein